jgi:glycosyltransferase involved in cell wall biosynthesis
MAIPPRRRWRARAAYVTYSIAAIAADLLPTGLRYGHVRTVTRAWLSRPTLPSVAVPVSDGPVDAPEQMTPVPSGEPLVRCVLATSKLDVGGIESVVTLLAHELPGAGVAVDVVCSAGGRAADALRSAGVNVIVAGGPSRALAALTDLGPHVVQLHNAPAYMADAARRRDVPMIPVVHNTEIHRSAADWRLAAQLSRDAAVTIAVSDVVGRHHLAHLPGSGHGDVLVIPNGGPSGSTSGLPSRAVARRELMRSFGGHIAPEDDDVFVLLCLARYDAQKNVPGLVAAFLDAAEDRPQLHLVVAGSPSDWLEYARADALRRSHAAGERVHLLGHSDPGTLLAAADAFVLDSFFEGWPVSATEAATLGLPLILADAGGAAELVGPDSGRGLVVPNAAGAADRISDRAVCRARRRARSQRNRADVSAAMRAVADRRDEWATRRDALAAAGRRDFGSAVMVARHAAAIRSAAGTTPTLDTLAAGEKP